MSISQIQKQRILDEVTRAHFSSGEKPRLIDILSDVSDFFARFPVGNPLELPLDNLVPRLRSDVDKFNEILARMALNIDILYQACSDQVEDIMTLTTLLRTELERLKAKREKLVTLMDDKLFTLYNTDGYYYSISDTFTTLDNIDLALTSVFIDTQSGSVQLPTLSSLTKRVDLTNVGDVSITAFASNKTVSYKTLGSFSSALDGLTNTLWGIEVSTDAPEEVVVVVSISLTAGEAPVVLSRLDFDPYGMVPVQLFVEASASLPQQETPTRIDFGESIKTSPYNMSFVNTAVEVDTLILTLRKTEPDYVLQVNGTTKYRYIFGAKNIILTEQVYDKSGILVTEPLFIDEDLADENVIDGVSLVVDADTPEDCEITYYVAPDIDDVNPDMDDFEWKEIVPLDDIVDNPNTIVRFDGARAFVKDIKPNPGQGDMKLIPLDNTNPDLTKRNPSSKIVPGRDIYRIAEFRDEGILPASISLEEGINSTRIFYTNLHEDGLTLEYWKDFVNGTRVSSTVYGQIDIGNEFFYGGDIGEAGKSVYVETYLESLTDQPLLLKEIAKIDPNSKVWDVKVFLNGREVADLPIGVDEVTAPWKFQQGLNHIAVLAQIPIATTAFPDPYIGTIDLMGSDDLFDFGTVKLATWQYIDIFRMQYNEVNQPYTFTIYNGEIVSRRKPTTNFRVRYSKSTDKAPAAIRLRADLTRSTNNGNVTPILKQYRLRFLYANS